MCWKWGYSSILETASLQFVIVLIFATVYNVSQCYIYRTILLQVLQNLFIYCTKLIPEKNMRNIIYHNHFSKFIFQIHFLLQIYTNLYSDNIWPDHIHIISIPVINKPK